MKDIYLHGNLGLEFGNHFKLDVHSVGESIRALEANFPGKFYKFIKDGTYRIQRSLKDPGLCEEDELKMNLSSKEIHIVPVIQGAKGGGGKGIFTVFLGVALIGAAIAFAPAAAAGGGFFGANMGASVIGGAGLFSGITWGQVALWGVGLALSGVSSLLSSQVNSTSAAARESPEERPSFLFNGATNNTEQGGPVPLVYGKMRVGSTVISGGITTEKLPT